jgi:hypothetical protein
MSRPIDELQARALPVLRLEGELRKKLINIAAQKSPSAAFDLAGATARLHGFSSSEALGIAKATRWLTVVRRDYGQAEFDRITA